MNNLSKEKLIFLAGMGRSGTTWASDIINYDKSFRVLFEPFLPTKVKEASAFEYIQYLAPKDRDQLRFQQAKTILTGKLRNSWVDKENNCNQSNHHIIIKDIRCNLMLGWLNNIAKELDLVLVIRHPLQVVDSWRELGWGNEYGGNRSDLEIVLSQQPLIRDFPLIKDVIKRVNFESFVERTVLLWGIFHHVPMKQLRDYRTYTLFYENLLLNPELEIRKLMDHLNRPLILNELRPVLDQYSSTNFQKRTGSFRKKGLLRGWKERFSREQIVRANFILGALGLDDLYDESGTPTRRSLFE